jgi:hypothetical protein
MDALESLAASGVRVRQSRIPPNDGGLASEQAGCAADPLSEEKA